MYQQLEGVRREAAVLDLVRLSAYVDLTAETGSTEMVPGSHRRDPKAEKPNSFESHEAKPRERPLPKAGEALIMDYRLWHRGLANRSSVQRHLCYIKYEKSGLEAGVRRARSEGEEEDADGSIEGKSDGSAVAAPAKKKPRRRVALTLVSTSLPSEEKEKDDPVRK